MSGEAPFHGRARLHHHNVLGVFILIFFLTWFLMAWSPTLLKKSGATVQQFSIAFGPSTWGCLRDAPYRPPDGQDEPLQFVEGAIYSGLSFVVALGFFSTSPFMVMAVVSVITGFFVFSCNSGLMALATLSISFGYQGFGYRLGLCHRQGGYLVAPTVGGLLLAQNLSVITYAP